MPPIDDLGYVHTFVPAKDPAASRITLLLLHGTGGDENDLLPLGSEQRRFERIVCWPAILSRSAGI